jgi:hypothetical protein
MYQVWERSTNAVATSGKTVFQIISPWQFSKKLALCVKSAGRFFVVHLLHSLYMIAHKCSITRPSSPYLKLLTNRSRDAVSMWLRLLKKKPVTHMRCRLQDSWRKPLKRNFKSQREAVTSDPTIQMMRAKFGRPGVSGRKRKLFVLATDDVQVNTKVPRFKIDNRLCL